MDYLAELGTLGLGSRLRRLSEIFFEEAVDVYRFYNFDLEPRYFSLLSYLHNYGPVGVTDAAKALHLTHPAVSQMSKDLSQSDWIQVCKDPKDERRSLLSLSEKGSELVKELKPIWRRFESSVEEVFGEETNPFLETLTRVEENLRETKFSKRVIRSRSGGESSAIELCVWDEKYKREFHDLNEEWVRRFFDYEEVDAKMLLNPEGEIRENGGEVFFATEEGRAIGTCALIKTGEDEFELVKMAVSRESQGQGIGGKLMSFVLNWAKEQGAHKVTLETNSQLTGAVKLYQRHGFRRVEAPHESAYDRVDFFMEKVL